VKKTGGFQLYMNTRRSRFSDQRGFNLIELMIVIAIIGLLIGVGSIAWGAMIRAGNENAAAQTLDRIRTYQVQYASRNRGRFATFPQLVASAGLDEKFNTDRPVVNGYVFTMTPEDGSRRYRPASPRPELDFSTPIRRSGRSRQTTPSRRAPRTHRSDLGFGIWDFGFWFWV
jgi:prepilin-type N-terminal cleavage/methylation domain-containing protein